MKRAVPGVYADLVTVAGFKPVVASEKSPGGFDSLPLPWVEFFSILQQTRKPAKLWRLTHFSTGELQFQYSSFSRLFVSIFVVVA